MQHLLLAIAQVGHDSSSGHKQILVPFPAFVLVLASGTRKSGVAVSYF